MPRKTTKSVAPAEQAKRIGLVICNSTFPRIKVEDGCLRLPGTKKDAKVMSAVLADPEVGRFSVRTIVDKGLYEVRREIAKACSEAGENDVLLIYYSGNGLADTDGTFYLLVEDTESEFLQATAVDADFVLNHLRRSRCRRFVLLIDGCHAGAFFNNNRGVPDGLYAITACGADDTICDTPEGGLFTAALARGLRTAAADSDGDGRVSVDELHDYVREESREHNWGYAPQKWVWNVPEPIYLTPALRPVFLSYAREDSTAADRLKLALEREGLSVWLDRQDVRSGNWKDRLTEGLNRSRALVFLLTTSSSGSRVIRSELDFATSKQVPIIPVEIDDSVKALPDWYRLDYDKLQRHRLNGKTYDDDVKALADAIRRLRKEKAAEA